MTNNKVLCPWQIQIFPLTAMGKDFTHKSCYPTRCPYPLYHNLQTSYTHRGKSPQFLAHVNCFLIVWSGLCSTAHLMHLWQWLFCYVFQYWHFISISIADKIILSLFSILLHAYVFTVRHEGWEWKCVHAYSFMKYTKIKYICMHFTCAPWISRYSSILELITISCFNLFFCPLNFSHKGINHTALII